MTSNAEDASQIKDDLHQQLLIRSAVQPASEQRVPQQPEMQSQFSGSAKEHTANGAQLGHEVSGQPTETRHIEQIGDPVALPAARSDTVDQAQPALEREQPTALDPVSQPQSSLASSERKANSTAVAGDLSGGETAFARPMQALISTVAKVGISPAAGMKLGSVATRTRRPKQAETASPQQLASSPFLTPAQGSDMEATLNGMVAASTAELGKREATLRSSPKALRWAAEGSVKPATTAPAAASSVAPVKDVSLLLVPQPAVQLQTPDASLGQLPLSGSKRSRRSHAAPQDACKFVY